VAAPASVGALPLHYQEKQMPNRLQWWRDRLTQQHVWFVAIAGVLLLAAAVVLLWIWAADEMFFYLGTGVIRLPLAF
jgi:hypothetical protein